MVLIALNTDENVSCSRSIKVENSFRDDPGCAREAARVLHTFGVIREIPEFCKGISRAQGVVLSTPTKEGITIDCQNLQ